MLILRDIIIVSYLLSQIVVYSCYYSAGNEIVASTFEEIHWDISQFISGEQMTLQLEGEYTPYFKIQEQIAAINEPEYYIKSIISQSQPKVLKSLQTQYWLNQYAFLENTDSDIYIYYADLQNQQSPTPIFNKFIRVVKSEPNLECVDLEFIDTNTFIISCFTDEISRLLIISKEGIILQELDQDLLHIQSQIVRVFQQEDRITILLGVIIDDNSIINIYQYQSNRLVFKNTLDSILLNILSKKVFLFNLRDVQIGNWDQIIILDKFQGVLHLKLNDQFGWVFIRFIDVIQSNLYYSMSVKDISSDDRRRNSILNSQIYLVVKASTDGDIIIFGTNLNEDFQFMYCKLHLINDDFKIQASKSMVVLTSGSQVILVSIENLQITKILENEVPIRVLVNPFQNLMILFTLQTSQAFQLSHGVLVLSPQNTVSQVKKKFKIIGTYKRDVCESGISFVIYDYRDSALHIINEGNSIYFPSIISYPNFPDVSFSIPKKISGPNQSVVMHFENNVMSQADYFEEITIKGFPQEGLVGLWFVTAYSLVNNIDLQLGQNKVIAYFVQTMDSNCYIYYCSYVKLNKLMQCSQQMTFTNKTPLTIDTFQMQESFEEVSCLYYGQIRNEHEVLIYKLINKKSTVYYTITTSFADQASKITQIRITQNKIYVLIPGKKLIEVHCILKQKLIFSLTEANMNDLGILSWAPTQMACNLYYNKEMILIVSGQAIIIGNIQEQFSLIKQIEILHYYEEIKIALFRNSFLLITSSLNTQQISQYTIQYYYNIQILKTIPLYHYKLKSPLQMVSDEEMGTMFILASSPVTQGLVVLVYQSESNLRDSLITSMSIPEKPNNIILSVISVNFEGYVFIQTGDGQKHYKFNQSIRVTVKPQQVQTLDFIQDIQVEVNYFNIDYPIRFTQQQQTQFVNLHTIISIQMNNEFQLKSNELLQQIQVEDGWIRGQQLSLVLSCLQCSEDTQGIIFVDNTVQFLYETILNFEIVASTPFGNDGTIALLTTTTLIFITQDTKQIKGSLTLDWVQYKPMAIVTQNNEFIAILGEHQFLGIKITLFTCINLICTKAYELIQESIKSITSIQMIANTMILINGNKTPPNYSSSIVYFYAIVQTNTGYEIIKQDYKLANVFAANDLVVVEYQQQYVLFMPTTYSTIYIVELQLQNNTLKPMASVAINVDETIKNTFKFSYFYETYIHMKLTQQPYLDLTTSKVIYSFIITTSATSSYGIQISGKGNAYHLKITYILLNFGTLLSDKCEVIENKYVAIDYFDYFTQSSIITIYQIPHTTNENLRSNPQLVIGGIVLEPRQFPTIFYLASIDDKIVLVYNSLNSGLAVYKISNQANIIIRNTEEFIQDQPITLIATNYFTSYDTTIKIRKYNNDLEVNNNFLWWIGLGVAVILLLMFIIILIVRKLNQVDKQSKRARRITLLN